MHVETALINLTKKMILYVLLGLQERFANKLLRMEWIQVCNALKKKHALNTKDQNQFHQPLHQLIQLALIGIKSWNAIIMVVVKNAQKNKFVFHGSQLQTAFNGVKEMSYAVMDGVRT